MAGPDINDVLCKEGDDGVRRLSDNARKVTGAPANGPQSGTSQAALTLRFGWDAAQPRPMGTIIRGLLHRGSLTLFYGPPKSGKSFLVTGAFLAIAADDKEWMGHPIVRSGPVLYVACEGHAGFWKRLRAAAMSRGWNGNTFPKNFVLATGRPHLIRLNDKTHAAAPCPDDVLAAVAQAKAKGYSPIAVAIDTVFRSIGAGNVNASDHMNAYLAALATITDQDIALAAVHHETKAGGTPAGSVTLIGGADTIVATTNLDDGTHSWHVEAAKDDAVTEPRKFRLSVINKVGTDPDGEEVSSCFVEPIAGPVAKSKTKDDPWRKQSLRSLRQALMNVLADQGKNMKPWANGPTVRAVDIEIIRPEFYRSYPAAEATDAADKAQARRKAFKRAIDDARAANLIGSWDVEGVTYVWLIDPVPPQPPQEEMPPPDRNGYDTSEGVAQRPRIGTLEIIGAEPPGAICAHCGRSDGAGSIATCRRLMRPRGVGRFRYRCCASTSSPRPFRSKPRPVTSKRVT
jgi:hypothetical protein